MLNIIWTFAATAAKSLQLCPSHFSCVRLCATTEMAAHQAPPSLGFSSKNTEVGWHFLLQCMKVKTESEVTQLCPTLSHGLQPTRLLHPWGFPGKSTGMGCHFLLKLMKKNNTSVLAAIESAILSQSSTSEFVPRKLALLSCIWTFTLEYIQVCI